ncbi:CDK-activating kinase assembly factor MAT1-like [Ornithodoros turicata]|uniref:CDK-activating kinase assembly factor MAT1 n=1 Tax=Ornithodoros turicata TaxID=34597 RepID=A0A2R5LB80_9ACAR
MDEIACPRCKTTKYRNPSLKLMVNVCGHALCESCVELLFVKGANACPQCNIALRRANFRLQVFEDAVVEKGVDIRKKILKDFNKREEDFESLRAYNDYLEEVETIIYNLTHDIDTEGTRRKVEQYKRENKTQIAKSKSKLSHDEELLEELLEQEQQETELRRQQLQEQEREAQREKIKQKEMLIDDLMFSDLPANKILATHGDRSKAVANKPLPPKPTTAEFSTGIKFRHREAFLPVPKVQEGPLYTYTALGVDLCGPQAPSPKTLTNYTANVRAAADSEKAGGFISDYACQRALQDAFCGLFFRPTTPHRTEEQVS